MYYNYSHIFLFLLLLLVIVSTVTSNDLIKRDDDDDDSDTTTTTHTTTTHTTTKTGYNSFYTSSTESSYTDETTNPVNQDIYNSKDLFHGPPNVTEVTSTVEVQLYCEVDTSYCKKVEQSFISAATKFSQVVNLKNKIVFQASYYSFCLNRCSNSTFGWGTPAAQFTLISLDQADSNFIYPQPLAKQWLQDNDNTNWASHDVAIDINHDMYMNAVRDDNWNHTGFPSKGGFWFNISNEPSIEDYQVDLEYLVLHQMIHGLGMVSSWAPYFSDTNSPFQQLLKGLIPIDNLKVMTPSPNWYVKQYSGPAYITGFQPNMIFDKFLNLKTTTNETVKLVEYGFDMQSFCRKGQEAFIVNFMNIFLNNATQSSRAKSMYVSMATPGTLYFQFDSNYYVTSNHTTTPSQYFINEYLNTTYKTIQLMTGPDILSPEKTTQESYYRPGISTSHVDDSYVGTPDFLMTHVFVRGKTLQSMIDEGYSNIPAIKYNTTLLTNVNVTTLVHNTTSHSNATYNVTTTETREQIMENVYKSAIGPGILRILETIGYSTVLTNTNYTSSVFKTNKPDTPCDDNNSNNARTDDPTPLSSTTSSGHRLMYSSSSYIIIISAIIMIK